MIKYDRFVRAHTIHQTGKNNCALCGKNKAERNGASIYNLRVGGILIQVCWDCLLARNPRRNK